MKGAMKGAMKALKTHRQALETSKLQSRGCLADYEELPRLPHILLWHAESITSCPEGVCGIRELG
jgi:hypothetical protein